LLLAITLPAMFRQIVDNNRAGGWRKLKAASDARSVAPAATVWQSVSVPGKAEPESPSVLIDAKIKELADWRGERLSRLRDLIKQAVPDVVEEVKWRKPSSPLGVPVWSCGGIICTGETYRDKVKLTFAKGASLEDPAGLFNSSLEGNVRRAIDFAEQDGLDEGAFRALVRSAAELNLR
jgi:hypothetical protein